MVSSRSEGPKPWDVGVGKPGGEQSRDLLLRPSGLFVVGKRKVRTVAGSDGPTGEELSNPGLSRWRRWLIRRSAVHVARRRQPSIYAPGEAKTTHERNVFFGERDLLIAALRSAAVKEMAETVSDLARLRLEIPIAEKAVERAEAVQSRGQSSGSNEPVSGASTSRSSEAVRRIRRGKAQAVVSANATAAVTTARSALSKLTAEKASSMALHAAKRAQFEASVDVVHRLALLKRDVFDEYLLKHHRHRELLDGQLDSTVPKVPDELLKPFLDLASVTAPTATDTKP